MHLLKNIIKGIKFLVYSHLSTFPPPIFYSREICGHSKPSHRTSPNSPVPVILLYLFHLFIIPLDFRLFIVLSRFPSQSISHTYQWRCNCQKQNETCKNLTLFTGMEGGRVIQTSKIYLRLQTENRERR